MAISRNRVNPETPLTPGPLGRRYGGVDSHERQRQRRAKLIQAALAVFGEHGFHQSTVRDVCKQAQLTSRYFYESFDSMEALFREVYSEISKELMQTTVMALARCQPDPAKLAEAALRAFLRFIQEDPHRARVALLDALTVGVGMNEITDKTYQDFAHLIGGFMQQMFPRLAESGLSHDMLANGLVGANIRIATQWVAHRCREPLEEVLHNTFSIFRACIAFLQTTQAQLPPAPQAQAQAQTE